jgi:hypothetical protein
MLRACDRKSLMAGRTVFASMLFIVFAILLASCGSETITDNGIGQLNETPEIGDGGFFSEEPCGPPCFWNIIPGVTTIDEAEAVLEAKNITGLCTRYNNEEARTRGVTCYPGMELGIGFGFHEDIVTDISFRTSETITLDDVVEKYGEPSAVFVQYTGLPEEPYRTMTMLYYDSIYTYLHLPEQESGVFEVKPSLEVQDIAYSSVDLYRRSRQRFSSDWKGYGSYTPQQPDW